MFFDIIPNLLSYACPTPLSYNPSVSSSRNYIISVIPQNQT